MIAEAASLTRILDRPFFTQDQMTLTPVSASPRSPSTMLAPSDARRSPFGRPLRSATAPVKGIRSPPSPDMLSSNLDCAFPPFPTSKPTKKPQQQQASGYGGLGNRYAEPDPMYAPISPRTAESGGLLQRMNTIAPGPFDMNGSRKANGPPAEKEKTHQRTVTAGSLRELGIPPSANANSHIARPSTASGHSRTSINSSGSGPRVPQNNDYGGFGPPLAADTADKVPEFLRPEHRSQTFPLRSESQGLPLRRPSESSDVRTRAPSAGATQRVPLDGSKSISGSPPRGRKQSISGPDLTRPLPPRGASLLRLRTNNIAGDAPPMPNLAAEFGIGNPYHTPTDSQSSNESYQTDGSSASSRSSPPVSSSQSRRKPSDTSNVDILIADIQSTMNEIQPKEETPSPPRNIEPIQPLYNRALSPQPESPLDPTIIDPAIQGGRRSPVPNIPPPRFEAAALEPPKTIHARRPTTSKGNCKGCKEPIKGKSVSSADGRLTGRYHKQCFVCTTCSEPFATATFYVIKDAPYCERHYHKLNGSICTTCDRGIEGQYLESGSKSKFHPGCLNCADCRRNLRHDYFEMNGKIYCERDAFRRAQQGRFLGPGGGGATNKMERRTTRLMMM